MKPKCKRCSYIWPPCGVREIPRTGCLYMTDVGICRKCDHAVSRLHVATPGDQLSAEIWGQRFEAIKRDEAAE